MKGTLQRQSANFHTYDVENLIEAGHPLRAIKRMVDRALADMSRTFKAAYGNVGQPGFPPETLLKALLLQCLCTIRSATAPTRGRGRTGSCKASSDARRSRCANADGSRWRSSSGGSRGWLGCGGPATWDARNPRRHAASEYRPERHGEPSPGFFNNLLAAVL